MCMQELRELLEALDGVTPSEKRKSKNGSVVSWVRKKSILSLAGFSKQVPLPARGSTAARREWIAA